MTDTSEDLALLLPVSASLSRIVASDLPASPNEHRTSAPRRKFVRYLFGLFLVTTIISGVLGRRKFIRTSSTATTKAKNYTATLSGAANITQLKREGYVSEGESPIEQFDDPKPQGLTNLTANETNQPNRDGGAEINGDRGSLDHGLNRRIPKRSPHHAYQCGYATALLNYIFPETNGTIVTQQLLKEKPFHQLVKSFQSDDVLLLTCGGPCPMPRDRILSTFPGPILHVNGESSQSKCALSIPPNMKNRVTSITRVGSDRARWNESTFNVALLVSTTPNRRQLLYQPEMRPQGTGKHFLIYANSHCVPYRNQAFRRLATIGPEVHYAGKCHGGKGVGVRVNETGKRTGYNLNVALYQDYRFTLAMENAATPGYISEKIMVPFLAGSVPIYYGTKEVFDIFNRNAFVWYDVNDEQPALDQIKYLEANRTAYAAMLREPILANGEETIAKYFSIRDEDGGGRLKWAIRDRIGFG
jgi:Glycosyltransferase family 10 (fucosyltransferase) C-term